MLRLLSFLMFILAVAAGCMLYAAWWLETHTPF